METTMVYEVSLQQYFYSHIELIATVIASTNSRSQ
jgi:hypothetical protein